MEDLYGNLPMRSIYVLFVVLIKEKIVSCVFCNGFGEGRGFVERKHSFSMCRNKVKVGVTTYLVIKGEVRPSHDRKYFCLIALRKVDFTE